jgi:bifunctional non-homologous end joining protein LigD
MPVTWDELKRAVKAKKPGALFFSPQAALQRLAKFGDLFAPVQTLKQALPKGFAAQAAPSDPLQRYREKRDFAQTAEPRPNVPKGRPGAAGGRFVIQKHAASHLHYDFRLEMDGTLKSWAVPKGIPTELGVKRSAFAVEDHPLSYMKFEGTIPKGQYGGGTVMVWDIGTYELLGGSYPEGSLKLMLHGKKLKGEWHMFRIRSDDAKPVWLIAKSGTAAKPLTARQDDSSVLTRRSMARIAKDNDAQWNRSR